MTSGSHQLRAELTRLTNPPADAGLEWLDHQIQKIAKLNEKYPHNIRLEARWSQATLEMNCFMYALNLNPDAIRDICSDDVFPGEAFVHFLISNGCIEAKPVLPSAASDNDVVIYFDAGGKPTHAGIIRGARIISKWGSRVTHIWEHEIFEVPDYYGDDVRVFRAPDQKRIVLAYIGWATEQL